MTLALALARLAGVRVLVVGDLVLDRMLVGRAARLSREAPIPVLDETRREDRPGGGVSPALTVVALGGRAVQAGVVGDDPEGALLRGLVAAQGVGLDAVTVDPDRPTNVKTRVVAEGFLVFPQQVARLDRVARGALAPATEAALIAAIGRCLAAGVDAVIVSDYGAGVASLAVIAAVRAGAGGALLAADAQTDPARFVGFDLVKCNQAEAERAFGGPVGAAAVAAGRDRLGCRMLAVTRGGDSALLAHPGGVVEAPAANRTAVYDVTGAGDAVIATLATALATGAAPDVALALAQHAGGVAVRAWGNQPVTVAALAAAIAAGGLG